MPLLSQILAARDNQQSINGIVVDVDDITPPEGVSQVGLMTALPDGNLEETVLDAAISYILAGISVTIEVPAATAIPDAKHLVSTAASIGASLALLPPDESSKEATTAYIDRVAEFANAYANQANFAKFLIPVTSYLQYLFVEVLDPELASKFEPTDAYLIEEFIARMKPQDVDLMKDRIKSVFHEAFGGPDGFVELGKTLFREIFERLEDGFKDQVNEAAAALPSA